MDTSVAALQRKRKGDVDENVSLSPMAATIERPNPREDSTNRLAPVLCQRGDVIFTDLFQGTLKPLWQPVQKTRWEIVDGVLVGQPATAADQAKARDKKHSGRSPSVQLDVPLQDGILQYSFNMGDKATAHRLVFNNGTHLTGTGHISTIHLHFRHGSTLDKRKNTKLEGDADEQLAASKWRPERGRWYNVMVEMRGEEIVAQIEDGPTLRARHERFATGTTWLSLSIWGGSTLAIDNVRICKCQ